MKRWNLQGYTLDTLTDSLTNLVLNGVNADRALESLAR